MAKYESEYDYTYGIKIASSTALTSVSTGAADNDKIPTKGYVDDNAGGGTPINATFSTSFETTTRVTTSTGGSGTATASNKGLTISTGATATSYTRMFGALDGSSGYIFLGNPKFSWIGIKTIGDLYNGISFLGIGNLLTYSGSGITFTQDHIGFKIIASGGTRTLYATQGDGTTESATVLTTVDSNDVLDLIAVITSGTSVDYYWRKNGGDLSAKTTISANYPIGMGYYYQAGVSNIDNASITSLTLNGFSYKR